MAAKRPKVYAVIPSAGAGTRMAAGIRKQFLEIAGKPMLVHTLLRFERTPDVDECVLVVPEDSVADSELLVTKHRLHKVSKVIVGGVRRQDSVLNALRLLKPSPADIVVVHDGVRPFVEPRIISSVIQSCREHGAAVLAVQPKDTVRRSAGGGFFDQTLDRKALWLVQTPQAFRARDLVKAHEEALADSFYSTDDAALVERIGIRAKIVAGSYDNIKITTVEDLELASLILQRWNLKGIG